MNEKIRIKDIARRAGVSVGTVDRVLHNRPNVSAEATAKVKQVLEELNYQPNVYASALAYNRSYRFVLLLPEHEEEAYWEEIEEGALKARDMRRDFHVTVELMFYRQFDKDSFEHTCQQCLEASPHGVIIVPTDVDTTAIFTDKLHELSIPFVLLDSYMPGLRPLSFYGQDSLASGYFAAKVLMMEAKNEKKIMLMKQTRDGKLVSNQQHNREVGFKHFMNERHPHINIVELNLPLGESPNKYNKLMDAFFAQHGDLHHGITFNSRAYIVGEYLLRNNLRDMQIMGYDMVGRNVACLRRDSVSFLIAQHAYMQGYSCVDTLFRAVVLKKEVPPVNYMPIELVLKENVDFYRRTQL